MRNKSLLLGALVVAMTGFLLASARAEAGLMREERDELRLGVEKALQQLAEP